MTDPIDKLLSVGSTPDWISPLIGLIRSIANGPSERITLNRHCGYSLNQIKQLLKSKGIKTWDDCILNDDYMVLSVGKSQSRWAHYVLTQAGVL